MSQALGGAANLVKAGTGTLEFHYLIQPGDSVARLDYASVGALTIAGAAIRNSLGTANATLTL